MRDRLYRSRDERVIVGVAGGIGDWLDVDPSLVRIAFVLAFILGGLGLVLYIVMALVVPEEPLVVATPAARDWANEATGAGAEIGTASTASTGAAPTPSSATWAESREARRAARRAHRATHDGRGPVIFGAILVLVGAWFLLRRFFPFLDGEFLGPSVLVLIGALLIAGAIGRSGGSSGAQPR